MKPCYGLYKDGEMVYLGGDWETCLEYVKIVLWRKGFRFAKEGYRIKQVTAK